MKMKLEKTSNIKIRLITAGSIFILSALSWLFFRTPIEKLGELIFTPALKIESVAHNLARNKAGDSGLSPEDELSYLRSENDALRGQLNIKDEPRVVAGVIGRPTALPYDVLVIDRGKQDGIQKDAPVYAGEYRVIGFVADVYEKSAVVALVTTPGFSSTVYVYGPNIYTTAIGVGGGVARIHVPQGISIQSGDIIALPSLDQGIFGTIKTIDSVPSRPEQYGYVTSDVAINSLRFVTVGTRPLSVISFEEARARVEASRKEVLSVLVPEGVLIDVASSTATSTETGTATSTATSTPE